MNRPLLAAICLVLATLVAVLAYHAVRNSPAPAPPELTTEPGKAFNVQEALRPDKLAAIVWVNDSGKPCKLMFGSTSSTTSLNLTVNLPAGPEPQGPVMSNAPITINKITLERDGKKVEHDFPLTIGPDETYEIHVGPDDQLKATPRTPSKKPAP